MTSKTISKDRAKKPPKKTTAGPGHNRPPKSKWPDFDLAGAETFADLLLDKKLRKVEAFEEKLLALPISMLEKAELFAEFKEILSAASWLDAVYSKLGTARKNATGAGNAADAKAERAALWHDMARRLAKPYLDAGRTPSNVVRLKKFQDAFGREFDALMGVEPGAGKYPALGTVRKIISTER